MNSKRVAFSALLLLAAGCNPAPQAPAGIQWDAAAAQEARAQMDSVTSSFVTMDREVFKNAMTEDTVGYDIDVDGKPVRLASRDEALRYFDELVAAVKKMGGATKMSVQSNSCRATTTLAYCVSDFDFAVTMPDGKVISQPSRATVVLRKDSDGWKWVHWHTSLAVLAAPAPAPE